MRFSRSLFVFAVAILFWPQPSINFAQSVMTTKERARIEAKKEAMRYQEQLKSLEQLLERDVAVIERVRGELNQVPTTELEIQAQIDQLVRELSQKQFIYDTSVISLLATRRVELMIELAGLNARQEAELAAAQGSDKSLQLLEEQIAIHEGILQHGQELLSRTRLLLQTGSTSDQELANSEHQLSIPLLRLLEKKQEYEDAKARNSKGAELTPPIAEKQAQLDLVERLLAEAASTRPLVGQLNQLQNRIERIRSDREMGLSEAIRKQESELAETKRQAIGVQIEYERLYKQVQDDEN